MNRQEHYDNILLRMHLPENYKKYDDINILANRDREDSLIRMYLAHIRDYLSFLSSENSTKVSDADRILVETSCDAAIRSVENLLNAKDWK